VSNFNESCTSSTDLNKHQISSNSVEWEPSCSMRTDGRTDRGQAIFQTRLKIKRDRLFIPALLSSCVSCHSVRAPYSYSSTVGPPVPTPLPHAMSKGKRSQCRGTNTLWSTRRTMEVKFNVKRHLELMLCHCAFTYES
jgi:hypothetical protein